MNLENLVAIAGMPGIYKVITNKGGGLIVEDLKDKKRQFVSSRQGAITPLKTIFIFVENTEEESTPLENIYRAMLEQIETKPVPAVKAADKDIKTYFYEVYPNLDKDRVYVSDMKKMLKWFIYLNDLGLLSLIDDVVEEEATPVAEEVPVAEVVETEAVVEVKPKKAAAKKKKEDA
jgi:hypothetical protein